MYVCAPHCMKAERIIGGTTEQIGAYIVLSLYPSQDSENRFGDCAGKARLLPAAKRDGSQ
jgi:hypothetical protein